MVKRKKAKYPTHRDIDKYRKEMGDFDEGADSRKITKYRREMGTYDE